MRKHRSERPPAGWRAPILEPLEGTLPEAEIHSRLAKAMIELKRGVADLDRELVSIRGVGLEHRIWKKWSVGGFDVT